MKINKTLTNALTQPPEMTNKVVEREWVCKGCFLQQLDPDIKPVKKN